MARAPDRELSPERIASRLEIRCAAKAPDSGSSFGDLYDFTVAKTTLIACAVRARKWEAIFYECEDAEMLGIITQEAHLPGADDLRAAIAKMQWRIEQNMGMRSARALYRRILHSPTRVDQSFIDQHFTRLALGDDRREQRLFFEILDMGYAPTRTCVEALRTHHHGISLSIAQTLRGLEPHLSTAILQQELRAARPARETVAVAHGL